MREVALLCTGLTPSPCTGQWPKLSALELLPDSRVRDLLGKQIIDTRTNRGVLRVVGNRAIAMASASRKVLAKL